jgi:YHYH protein/Secretion system C-terminal sorting domain
MKNKITLLAILCSSAVMAQFPLADEWMLNTDGTTASYEYYPGMPPTTQTVNLTDSADVLTVCYDNDYVYIRANGLASYLMGPWAMNPNEPAAILKTYRFPRNPQEEMGAKEDQPFGGALGIAINGVSLYGIGDARSYNTTDNENNAMGDGLWNSDAWVSEGPTLDASGLGHADGNENYHYHATPVSLYPGSTTTHSPIVGWSFDGFPIYGPYGYDSPYDAGSGIVRIETGYSLRSITDRTILPGGGTSTPPGPAINATFPLGTYQEDWEFTDAGHLDEYNGRWCVTPEFPDTIYAYFVTKDAAGDPEYPYYVGPQYFGVVNASEVGGGSGNITIPGGVTCLGGTNSVDEVSSLEFSLYPNPSNGILNAKGVDGANYTIVDQVGRVVSEGKINSFIDIEKLENGMYHLYLELEGKRAQSSFVKK